MNHIFLIGFMGAGKTSVGKALSTLTGVNLIDTDSLAVEREGRSIPKIFKEYGEGYFRRLEYLILVNISEMPSSVVSCGGGVAIRDENIKLMKSCGKICYLRAKPQTILKRVEYSNNRPLLEGKKNIEDITGLMEQRVHYYENAADIIVDVDDRKTLEIAEEIRCLVDF